MVKDLKKVKSSGVFLSTLLGASSAISLVAFAPLAMAQETVIVNDGQTETTEVVDDSDLRQDVIVVKGFKKSLQDAIDAKRNSNIISDGISAEDIGKSSDQNIAEALQRVTGVSISRQDGEGSTVTIRGVDPNLNNVTINGVTVTNAAGDVRNGNSGQAVDFSAFSSDILSRIEVAKTASADQEEGSLGGSINLTTFKPLNFNKERRVFEVQTRINDLRGEDALDFGSGGERFNVALSEKLANDTIGLSLVATHETSKGRTDQYNAQRFEYDDAQPQFTGGTPAINAILSGGITNQDTGALDRLNADGTPVRFILPFELSYEQIFFETERSNLAGAFQWQPSSQTDIQFDVTLSETNRKRDLQQFEIRPVTQFFPVWDGANNVYDPSTGDVTSFRNTTYSFGPGNARNPGYIRPARELQDITEQQVVLGFDLQHEWEDFTFNFKAGNSRSTAKDNDFLFATTKIENQPRNFGNFNIFHDNGFHGSDGRPGIIKGYDCNAGGVCQIFLSDTVDNRTRGGTIGADPNLAIVDDPFEWDIGNLSDRRRKINDNNAVVFFDVDWDKEIGPFTSFETGVKWAKRKRSQGQTNQAYNPSAAWGDLREANITQFTTSGQFLSDGWGEELGFARDNITDGIVGWDPRPIRDALQALDPNIANVSPSLRDNREMINESYAVYLKSNFELFDGRAFGDIGLRYVNTDVASEGGAFTTVQFQQFANQEPNLQFFGFFGPGDPANTATFEEAQAAIVNVLGADLVPQNDPRFVQPEVVLASDTHSYDNFLPSLNFNYALRDDMVLRFAASQTMARPNIDFTRANFDFRENTFAESFVSAGNPKLDPLTSNNLDLSFEWYFDDSSLFSVALFDKDIQDSVRNTTEAFYIRDPRDIFYDADGIAITDPSLFGSAIGQPGLTPGQGSLLLPFDPNNQPTDICLTERVLDLSLINGERRCEPVRVATAVNAANAYVRGAEIALVHNFDNLPGIWGGFGVSANYTYSDSEVEAQTIVNAIGEETVFAAAPLPNTSLHTFNSTVFYEQDGKLLRLAYNTRSDFLISSAPVSGMRFFGEGFDTLDASGAWEINDNLTLNFQAVNLLDTVARRYAVLEGDVLANQDNPLPGEALSLGDAPDHRTQQLRNTGRIFRVGLRYEF